MMDKNSVTRTFSIGAICSGTKTSDDFYAARRHSSAGIRALLWATSSAKSLGCSLGSDSQTSRENIFPNILTPDSIPQFTIPSLSVQNSLRSLDKETEEDYAQSEEGLGSELESCASLACSSTISSSTSSSGPCLVLSDRRAERSVSDPFTKKKSLLQREVSYPRSQTEAQHCLDPASRAALSLPHLTKVTTPYGFITLSQSPQMASEEALLCQAGLRRLNKDEETACCLGKAPGTRTVDNKGSSSHLFSSFDDQRVVFQGIQHRHLLFLRSMAQSVEAEILLHGGEATERDVSSYQPQDFLMSEGSAPKQIGNMVYYSLHSPKLPGRVLGLRVHKQTDEASSGHQPSHVNVQDAIAHFHPSNTPRTDSSILQTQDPSRPFKSDCSAVKPPGGGSTDWALARMNINLPSVESFLQRGHSVSVERDLPYATLDDFVQESRSLQSTDSLDYDKQVCVLLLQILTGLQHLYISASAAELRPREIFLVWPDRKKEEGDKIEQDASEMKSSRLKEKMELEKTERKGKIQMLWKTHGSPRVVLTPASSALSVPHPLAHINSHIGALIQYCLDPQENLTSLGPVPTQSSYRRGLLYLASRLQSESSGPQMADMVATLQVLLWGPRVPLFNQREPMTTAVHNWLTIKRALLVMKLAERGLIQDQSALDWEDCMCLQYLSFTDPETVVSVTSQLWFSLNVD